MATLRFLLKRFVAQRSLGLAIVVTLAFSVGVLVAGPIYADAAREAILSSELTGAPPTVRNVRLQVFGDESFDWAAADEVITDRADRCPCASSFGKAWEPYVSARPPGPPRRSSRGRASRNTWRSAASPRARMGSSCTRAWRSCSASAEVTVWTSSVPPANGCSSSSSAPTSAPIGTTPSGSARRTRSPIPIRPSRSPRSSASTRWSEARER